MHSKALTSKLEDCKSGFAVFLYKGGKKHHKLIKSMLKQVLKYENSVTITLNPPNTN